MAPKVSQLQTLPWSAFVGASILLHIGILIVGLPRLIQVNQPPGNAPDIPITLVQTETETAATSSVTASQPAAPSSQQAVAQATPRNNQTFSQTIAQPPKPTETSSAAPVQPPPERNQTNKPDSNDPKLSSEPPTVNNSPNIEPPESETQPPKPPADDAETTDVGTPPEATNGEPTSRGPTKVTIEDAKSINELGGGTTQPKFSFPQTLSIPQNSCPSGALPNSLALSVEITGNGDVISLKTNAGQLYDPSPPIITADCLLMAALSLDPSIRFTPTQPDTGENNPVNPGTGPSVAGQFILSFE